MSVTPGNLSLNGTSFLTEHHSILDKPSEQRTWNVFLFCLTLAIALPALLGSIYSLVSLLKLQTKSTVSWIVTSVAADDLISMVPVIIFMLMQWSSEVLPQPLCTTSAFLYLFQGISSNLKGSLIVSYNFYTLSTPGTLSCSSSRRRVSVAWAILAIWTVSLLLCTLPLCGWGGYIPTSWGCFGDCGSSHTVLVLAVYSLCLSLLAVLAVPLSLQLLCSGEPQVLHTGHPQGSAGCSCPGTPWGCGAPRLPLLDPGDRAPEPSQASEVVFGKGLSESGTQSRSSTVGLAQKRFSLILALTKVLLWLPMMIHMAVQYITGLQSLSFEALSFLLTVLAAAVTPVFVLSQHWLHLPCGCIINCRSSSHAVPSPGAKSKHGGFEFNLSFQQGCGIYRISLESPPHAGRNGKPSSYPSLDQDQQDTSPGPFPEGPEWRLCHQESPTPELSDWEWCRSRSERNPRQRTGGALAVPLCAFQGTVSLQAPGGKTLSLSTYEVSSEGQKIAPAAKRIEVYRSKSVGHEPSPGEPGFADTSVKIHLEVLEICDTPEALDTVSIVSSISQSSAHARSPSLRYSRKENRFVSCELGESASYSLLVPSNSDFSISIPDTVEAHRRSSQQQGSARAGYQEEIQLLNRAYREREGSS
ncbi:putative G-protein coupled receptor 149 [Ammospiza maritima maritima]